MDLFVFNFINDLSHKYWLFDYLGVFFAQYFGYFLFIIIVFLIFQEKGWRERIYFTSLISLSAILSRGIITEIIKFISHRPRPFLSLGINSLVDKSSETYLSFPSGHAALFFALGFAIFLYYFNSEDKAKKSWGWKFLVAAFLISLARVFTGVHWPSDILAGAAIGIISAYLIKKLLDREFKKEKAPISSAPLEV